jgi:DNA-binding response OmpR family regulator
MTAEQSFLRIYSTLRRHRGMVPSPPDVIATLIVETTLDAAQSLGQSLAGRLGHRLRIVTSANRGEAMKIVASQQIDLVIANVHIPGGGLALCRDLRALPQMSETPILLLNEHATAQEKIDGFASGADDYVVRPIDDRLLAARIELLWRIKHMEQLRGDPLTDHSAESPERQQDEPGD